MFNKLGVLLILTIVSFGCSLTGGSGSEETPAGAESNTKAGEIADGDTVVARWTSTSFYEGKASDIRDDKINVAWTDGSKAKDVDRADVFALPKVGTKPDVKVGDVVLAKISTNSYWNGATIKEINGEVYVVQAVGSSSTTNVDGHKILKISAATAANFEKRNASRDFLKTAGSKSPKAPDNFKPKKGDKVIALWSGSSWYQGKVDKVSGDKVTVAWEDASKPKEVDMDKVIPFPNSSNTEMPEVDQYVLTKPRGGSRWNYAQVTKIDGTSITVKNSNGQESTLKKGEAVPLS